jgi:hypothetical protein
MARKKRHAEMLRLCIRCGHGSFDPVTRDVSDWLLIEDLNASEHCRSCWIELARTRGRPLGRPDVPLGMIDQAKTCLRIP